MLSLHPAEFAAYDEWLRKQWNRPSRTDHYLMRLMAVVASITTRGVRDNMFQIEFEFGPRNQNESSDESFDKAASQIAIAELVARNPVKPVLRTRSAPIPPRST